MNDALHGRTCISHRFPPANVFASWSQNGSPESMLRPTEPIQSWTAHHCEGDRLWCVSSSVREVLRFAPGLTFAIPPEQLASYPQSERSGLRLQISADQVGGPSRYLIDVGQSLEIYAEALQVDLLGPPGIQLSRGAEARRGLLADSAAVARCVMIEQSRGARSALLTQFFRVTTNAPLDFPIPNAARAVTVFPLDPAIELRVTWSINDPPAGLPIGDEYIPANSRRSEVVVPPLATHIRILSAESARTVTFVWRVVP